MLFFTCFCWCIGLLVPFTDFFIGWEDARWLSFYFKGVWIGPVYRSLDIPELRDGFPLIKAADNLKGLSLSHSIDQKVGLRIKNDGFSYLVTPVVIVTEPS